LNLLQHTALALVAFSSAGISRLDATSISITTAPAGFLAYSFEAGTRYIGVPLVTPALFTGKIATVSGAAITSPSFSAHASALLLPGNSYYIEIVEDLPNESAHEGQRIDIDVAATLGAGADTIVLKSSPANTLALPVPSALVETRFVLREHITLGSLTQSLPGAFLTGDSLSFEQNGTTLITVTYNGTQWRSGFTNHNPMILYPGIGAIFKRSAFGATATALIGAVRNNAFVQPLKAGSHILSEGFPVDSAPSPSDGGPDRKFTNASGNIFAAGDRLSAHHPTTGALTTYTYSTSASRWAAGFINANTLRLFQAGSGFYLTIATSNPAYTQPVPFSE